jgi:phenylalanyl-tRNA synthetase beta subunit
MKDTLQEAEISAVIDEVLELLKERFNAELR